MPSLRKFQFELQAGDVSHWSSHLIALIHPALSPCKEYITTRIMRTQNQEQCFQSLPTVEGPRTTIPRGNKHDPGLSLL